MPRLPKNGPHAVLTRGFVILSVSFKGNMEMDGLAMMLTRRKLLQAAITAGVWHMLGQIGRAAQAFSMKDIENMQKNWRGLLAKDLKSPSASEPLKLSKDEWRKRLD